MTDRHIPIEWNPPKYQCRRCADVIWSKCPGQFVSCKCDAIAVDQTRHYSRYLGQPDDFLEVTTDKIGGSDA